MNRNPLDLKGRNAIVTGGARGIGAAAALALARHGADIIVADLIDASETIERIKAMNRKGIAVETDVAEQADVRDMVDRAIEVFGHVDILVNNAGVMHRDSLLETSEATWETVVGVIMKGTFFCIQAIYPHMRLRGYGRIVNVSSILGIVGGTVSRQNDPMQKIRGRSGPAYSAANGGVIALTKWIANDVAKDGIHVNCIAAGVCETEMTKGYDFNVSMLPISRMGTPEEIADAIVFLASDASSYITGQVLNVDGGWVTV